MEIIKLLIFCLISPRHDKKSTKSLVCFIYPQLPGLGLQIFIISFGDGAKSLAKTKCRGNGNPSLQYSVCLSKKFVSKTKNKCIAFIRLMGHGQPVTESEPESLLAKKYKLKINISD